MADSAVREPLVSRAVSTAESTESGSEIRSPARHCVSAAIHSTAWAVQLGHLNEVHAVTSRYSHVKRQSRSTAAGTVYVWLQPLDGCCMLSGR